MRTDWQLCRLKLMEKQRHFNRLLLSLPQIPSVSSSFQSFVILLWIDCNILEEKKISMLYV